jgi:hypothetical protein
MAKTFAELVDEVRIDARRAEIARHARDSMEEEKFGSWEFTSDTAALLAKLHGA